jgi:hypothetical protein
MEKYKLSVERKQEIRAHLDRAISALLDAQISMLQDAPYLDSWEVSERIEDFAAYEHMGLAEREAVDALRELQKT